MKLGEAIEALVGAVRLRPGLPHEDYVAALDWPAWRVTIAATRASVAGRLVRSGHGPSVRYWPIGAPVPVGVAPEAWALLEQLVAAAGDEAALEQLVAAAQDRPVGLALRAWVAAGRPVSTDAPTRQRWRIWRPRGAPPVE